VKGVMAKQVSKVLMTPCCIYVYPSTKWMSRSGDHFF
jgi:hypothetical protein